MMLQWVKIINAYKNLYCFLDIYIKYITNIEIQFLKGTQKTSGFLRKDQHYMYCNHLTLSLRGALLLNAELIN